MLLIDILLIGAAFAAVVAWAVLAAHVASVQRGRTAARATVAAALAALGAADVAGLPLAERIARIRSLLDRATRELIMQAAADDETPAHVVQVLTAYLTERWGADTLERDAASHTTARSKWRRIAALRILFRGPAPRDGARSTGAPRDGRSLALLAAAVADADSDVGTVALSLLGNSDNPQAADILVDALKRRGGHPASRVAVHLDRSPLHLADRLRALLPDSDPVVRLWAATLLGRYPDVDGLERELAALADDEDARVRKAAVQALGLIGDTIAGVVALRLLDDPVPFVRATALRALGKLGREDLAEEIAARLGDRDWWVRFAAKECLESLGPEIWPVLLRLLDDPDRFVRNGAAEVFQNLGVLDSLIVMEAATDDPAAAKIDLLRRIALAGGLRLTDSLIERAGSSLGPRVRQLLVTIGLEHVGAV
jgi:HEAT repeat protein